MMNSFFRAPLDACCNLAFYREVRKSELSRGFLYLLYLAGILTVILYLFFLFRGAPTMDRFVDWVKEDIPPLTWTPEGLVMNSTSPYIMVHPEFGPLAVFDTSVSEIDAEAMGEEMVFITSRKAYVRKGTREIRVYDLTQAPESRPPDQLVMVIDDLFIENFYNGLKPWIHMFIWLFFVPFAFIWKLLEGLLYSWVGVLINMTRKTPLGYGAILNVCFFALTPAALLQFRGFILPPLGSIPFGFLGSLLVTSLFLFFIFKSPQEEESSDIPDAI